MKNSEKLRGGGGGGHTSKIIYISVVKCPIVPNMFLKRLSFGSKECTNELKLECANFLGQAS